MASFAKQVNLASRKSMRYSKVPIPIMDEAAYEEYRRKEILKILRTDPESRNNSQINALVEYTQDIKFFKELSAKSTQSAHISCCHHMFYEFVPKFEFVFRYGDQGTKFYIIIQGRVSVELPTLNDNSGTYELVEALQLGDGAAFGELALEDSSKTRAASIKCVEDTHFAVIEKSDFKRILFKLVQDKRMELVNFLSGLPLFKSWTKGSLTKLTYFFKEKHYVRNQIIYREGETADDVFVVNEGEFKFNKKIQIRPQSDLKNKSKQKNLMNKQNQVHLNDVCILSRGEIFGEDEVIEDKRRNFTCVCHSIVGSLYVISKAVRNI
jgi:CRP-like cAMP-binding protein